MKLITFPLRRSRKIVLFSIAAGLLSGASSVGLLALINSMVSGSVELGMSLLVSFLLLCLAVFVTRTASGLLLNRLGQETIFELRMDLSWQVLRVPLRELETLGPHRVLATLTGDIPSITGMVAMLPTLFINLAILVCGLAYLAWLSWQLFAVVVVLLGVGVVLYQFPINRATNHLRNARSLRDDLYEHFRGLTEGIKELKLHVRRRDAFLESELETTAGLFRDENILGLRIFTVASSWGQVFVFLAVGLLLFFLPQIGSVDLETRSGYALTLLYLMSPLQTLMNALPDVGRANASLERVEAMGLQLAAKASPDTRDVPARDGEPGENRLELVGATHAYHREGEDGDFVLGPVDLALRSGEILIITGGNGSGKTTLAKLLTGLYTPDSGGILWNGRPVTDENRVAYRQNFSAVFFDFYLFPSFLGIDGGDLDARADRYLERLQLRHKVTVQDGRLSTLDLSQGQRKRLALLTAYLEDRSVYLFDEWAADQDPHFKEIFYRQILPELKARNKAVVVISHDDRYYDVADRVVKLENGRCKAEELVV